MTNDFSEALYHKRTLAVTEAYARTLYLSFKILINRCLICGIFFCNQ